MPLQLEELIEAFDRNRTLFGPDKFSAEESERIRSTFVSDFPIERISQLKLDATPDFTAMEGEKIMAIFDAKN
jgi:hypothetical protein